VSYERRTPRGGRQAALPFTSDALPDEDAIVEKAHRADGLRLKPWRSASPSGFDRSGTRSAEEIDVFCAGAIPGEDRAAGRIFPCDVAGLHGARDERSERMSGLLSGAGGTQGGSPGCWAAAPNTIGVGAGRALKRTCRTVFFPCPPVNASP